MAYSLYGEVRQPTPQMLKDVDVLVVDVTGCRHARLHLHLHDGAGHAGGARRGQTRGRAVTGPNPIGGVGSKAICWNPATNPLSECFPSRCATA
jgi:uncharacterized protein YbbC (DUF1343 family)